MQLTPLGGRYKIINQLGSGGFSCTFLVEDLHLPGNPRCVIKQLMPQATSPDSLEMARRLFDTEANALYKLGSHTQIPTLLAHFEEKQEFYLAQEFIEGSQLSQHLILGKPWSEAKVIFLLREILEILSFVHQQQVIHRDVKPSNLIRRRQDGKIVLIDFGAVKQVSTRPVEPETSVTNLTIAIGTQGYMPNEQFAGKPRFSSDVYAVGMIGIRALTGVHPKKLDEDPRTSEIDWHNRAPWVSTELKEIVDRMVRYDFRDRYPNATEALKALQNLPIELDEGAIQAELQVLAIAPQLDQEAAFRKLMRPLQTVKVSTQVNRPSAFMVENTRVSTASAKSLAAETTDLLGQSDPIALTDHGTDLTTILPKPRRPWLITALIAIATLATVGVAAVMVKAAVSPQMSGQMVGRIRSLWHFSHSPEDLSAVSAPFLSETVIQTPKAILQLLPPEEQAALLLVQADQLRSAGDYQAALGTYDKAIELQNDLAPAYLGQCEIFNVLKESDSALVACNDALAFNERYPEALRGKGNAFEQKDRRLEALRLYEQATRLKPDLAAAWLDQGRVLQHFGRSVEAIRALDHSIDLNRDSANAWAIRGEALWNLGRYDQAIIALDKALQIEPTHPAASELRQKMREDLGR